MRIIHTLLWYMNENDELRERESKMIDACLHSLEKTADTFLVIYNQGFLTNSELSIFLRKFNFKYVIIGDGKNVGIPIARQACFEYIWAQYPDVEYISEIHLDMIFPKDWYKPLVKFLDTTDEPVVSPGIILGSGQIFPNEKGKDVEFLNNMPKHLSEWENTLELIKEDKIIKGYPHPAIHKNSCLKEVGGYDLRFFKGKQNFEDDSLLLGYLYYMGLKNKWYPKSNFNSVVFHPGAFQRLNLNDYQEDWNQNLQGLLKMYGAYGFKHLSEIHAISRQSFFISIFNQY